MENNTSEMAWNSNLPKDPAILLGYVNTKLRDKYRSLEELCEDLHVDQEQLEEELAKAGFEYSRKNNKFW